MWPSRPRLGIKRPQARAPVPHQNPHRGFFNSPTGPVYFPSEASPSRQVGRLPVRRKGETRRSLCPHVSGGREECALPPRPKGRGFRAKAGDSTTHIPEHGGIPIHRDLSPCRTTLPRPISSEWWDRHSCLSHGGRTTRPIRLPKIPPIRLFRRNHDHLNCPNLWRGSEPVD